MIILIKCSNGPKVKKNGQFPRYEESKSIIVPYSKILSFEHIRVWTVVCVCVYIYVSTGSDNITIVIWPRSQWLSRKIDLRQSFLTTVSANSTDDHFSHMLCAGSFMKYLMRFVPIEVPKSRFCLFFSLLWNSSFRLHLLSKFTRSIPSLHHRESQGTSFPWRKRSRNFDKLVH